MKLFNASFGLFTGLPNDQKLDIIYKKLLELEKKLNDEKEEGG